MAQGLEQSPYVDIMILCVAKCRTAKIISTLVGFREQEDDEIGTTVHRYIVGKGKGNKMTIFTIYHLCYINSPFMSMVNKREKMDRYPNESVMKNKFSV